MTVSNHDIIKFVEGKAPYEEQIDYYILGIYELVRLDNRIPYNQLICIVSDLREHALEAYERGRMDALKGEGK